MSLARIVPFGVPLSLLCAWASLGQAEPRDSSAPAAATKITLGGNPLIAPPSESVIFSKRLLAVSANEGSAVVDVNRDGRLDVIAGRHWFAAPDFVPRPLRQIGEFADYLHSNGDHVFDVNRDGWPDVIASSFHDEGVWWYENPKAELLEKGHLWKAHLLKRTNGENEIAFFRDLDGDRVPEFVVNRWKPNTPLIAWKLVAGETPDRGYTLERKVLSDEGNVHGFGFGDVNGDGREDILSGWGWWERPPGDPFATRWTFHKDWKLDGASCPMLVVDLNDDGRNDVIWGRGHDFGLYWREQLPPAPDGTTKWKERVIDESYSQAHSLHWADIDGDGRPELITGKRVRAHSGKDPGGTDASCLYYYSWDPTAERFLRHTIDEGGGVGTGLQIRTTDLNGDGRLDIVVSGKSGTWILTNEGRAQ